MADLVYMAKSAWTALLNSVRAKCGTSDLLTAAQAKAAVDGIDSVPAYLGHTSMTLSEDSRSIQIPVGEGARAVLISSDYNVDEVPSVTTVFAGCVVPQANGTLFAGATRLVVVMASGSLSYYTSNSSGAQSWSYQDGVLTISNGSGWWFAAGVQYDFYWY